MPNPYEIRYKTFPLCCTELSLLGYILKCPSSGSAKQIIIHLKKIDSASQSGKDNTSC